MRVSGHKCESSIRYNSRRVSEVKQKEISHALMISSACSVENLESTSTAIVVMYEQTSEILLAETQCQTPLCRISHLIARRL